MIRIDLPGAGQSPPLNGTPSVEGLADAVVRAARTLGVERAHFVGHSMGTIICQLIAAEHAGLVASLTLFGPLSEPSDAMRTGLAARARLARQSGMTPIADQIIEAALSSDTKSSRPAVVAFVRESVMRQDPEGYAGHCEALAKTQAADHRMIAAPALLVCGDADSTAPASAARGLAERLKGASVVVLERSGHWLTLEKPAECNDKMRDFIARLPAG